VSVVTRTADGAAGARLTYDHAGRLAGTAAAARAPGTTVAVRELFRTLPVRFKARRAASGSTRRPARGARALRAACAAGPRRRARGRAGVPPEREARVCEAAVRAAGVRAHRHGRPHRLHQPRARRPGPPRPCAWGAAVTPCGLRQVGRGARSTVVSTQGAASVRDNIVTVFGSRVADGLEPLGAEGPSGARIAGRAPPAACPPPAARGPAA